MGIEACFKWAFRDSKIFTFGFVACSDRRAVYNTFGQAVSTEWAVLFISAITFSNVGVWSWSEHFGVVAADYGSHIGHTAITHFYSVPVKKLVVTVMFGEMFINQA